MSTPYVCPLAASVAGGLPLTVHVVLTPSEEVEQLQNQIKDLRQQVLDLRQESARAQGLFQAESILNLELIDLCDEYGVPVRQVIRSRRGRSSS